MKTITINLYEFSELSEDAQQKAIESLYGINVDHEWWDCTYEDAKTIGLKITSFDLDRSRHAEGEFIEYAIYTASLVLENHGETCETYKTSKEFDADYNELKTEHNKLEKILDEEYNDELNDKVIQLENDIYELKNQYLKDIIEDYSIMLQNEYEYLQSEESIKETINGNEFQFTENGNQY